MLIIHIVQSDMSYVTCVTGGAQGISLSKDLLDTLLANQAHFLKIYVPQSMEWNMYMYSNY